MAYGARQWGGGARVLVTADIPVAGDYPGYDDGYGGNIWPSYANAFPGTPDITTPKMYGGYDGNYSETDTPAGYAGGYTGGYYGVESEPVAVDPAYPGGYDGGYSGVVGDTATPAPGGGNQIDSGAISLSTTASVTATAQTVLTVDSGSITLTTTTTISSPTVTVQVQASATLTSTGSITASGAVVVYTTPTVGGFEFHTSAYLSLVVSEAPTLIEERDLLRVSPTMRTPIFLQGRPVHPDIVITGTMSVTAGGAAANPDPPATSGTTTPTGGAPAPTYKWLASSLGTGAISSWPATGGGPSWSSAAPFRPKVGSLEVNSTLTYSKVVYFWNDYVEHMWADLGATKSQPYTWQIVAVLMSISDVEPQNMLDSGGPTPGTYTATQRVRNTRITEPNNTHLMKVLPDQAQMWAGNNFGVLAPATRRACVYTGCFNGVDSFFRIRGKNYRFSGRGHPGLNATRNVVLGRRTGILDEHYASHMAVLEVRYYNQAVTESQLEYNIEPALFATYNFAKW